MRRVYGLAVPNRFTLNLGSGETSIGDVTLDIDRKSKPNIVADATRLPIKDESFDQVIFADVIEHVPKGTEAKALSEILRILRPDGELILSTPTDRPLYKILDPAYHFTGHRHYNPQKIVEMAQMCGFEVVESFTAGGFLTCLDNLFVMGTKTSRRINRAFLERMVEKEYATECDNGYTLFLRSRKRPALDDRPSSMKHGLLVSEL